MNDATSTPGEYLVVARRYRPQRFEELVGQEHVAQSLQAAIASGRVGHAYLFTGARGVGKTSAARILAKCLNCERGTSPTPCGECEICDSVAAGADIDVLEIDGASNNGVDEVRELRQNAGVMPSRARYKIYIIDEVHMLSKSAFNALLKILEEPPEHVKFIFATTEANKIPITILSRCQRYDFAGIDAKAIHARLAEIAAAEGVEADEEALAIIAIRAAGSMRDSQSLLEQLLATGARRITAGDVTTLLGLAPAVRLSRLVTPLVERNAAAALAEFDAALGEGAEPGQLVDQLLGYFRDVMTQAVGCSESQLLYALPGQREEIRRTGEQLGIETLLAICQVLDQTASRLRTSTQVRTLAEMALVRICRLHDLDELAALVEQLKSGEAGPSSSAPATRSRPAPDAAKKNGAASAYAAPADRLQPRALPGGNLRDGMAASPSGDADDPPAEPGAEGAATIALDEQSLEEIWKQALDRLMGMVVDHAAAANRLALDAQGRLVASFPKSLKFHRDCLGPPAIAKIEAALAAVCGRPVTVALAIHDDPADALEAAAARPSPKQQQTEVLGQPFVRRAMELFDVDPSRARLLQPQAP
jgi:DNA polymerase-3 subunit gamma/tau